ncbi:MAG: 3-hydroxyacyl-CoA dehydrogenase family protein [Euryarchaeota archaeon]|nr:3-hydroxyacyl-CoA dehydrogenase family protein [Euryarchaeota archaeon]
MVRGPDEIRQVMVIGAGTMGHGIAQVSAMAGYRTMLVDVKEEFVAHGIERIKANLQSGVERGKVTEEACDAALKALSTATDLGIAAAKADLVIEAVPEDMELKKRIFRTLDEHAPEGALLTSNTSSLSVAEIASATSRPGSVLGMHFFNPVHIMKLLEIVWHDDTDDAALATAAAVGKRMDKDPIVVKDSPGFATSRLGIVLGNEAIRMVEEGVASPEDIDKAMELGYRHPMGPLKLSDIVGLDVRLNVSDYLHDTLGGEHYKPPELLRRLVKEGKLGKKTGEGFYKY